MQFPEVEIGPEESLLSAATRVARTFEARGSRLHPFDHLNALLPTSSVCHFFQTRCGGRESVIVVMPREWSEQLTLTVLNILLNIRMDPDPPGPPPLFRFYCAHPVPPVLRGLFGDSPASDFECRAALVAQFGSDVAPSQAFQLAAVAMHLLRETLGISSGFFDPDGDLRIAEAVTEGFRAEEFPEDASPLNAIIALGFLYGEILRARIRISSRWVRIKDSGPWPSLVFGSSDPAQAENAEGVLQGLPQVVFNPIGSVINVYQAGSVALLREATATLADLLRSKLSQLPT